MISSIFRRPLAREIGAVLVIKIIAITLASLFLFGPDNRVAVNGSVVAQHLLNQD